MTEIRDLRKRAVLPIGTVIQLTELSARQIRYYEAQGLIQPERTPGNHRLYALRDVEDLLSIKEQLDSGLTLARSNGSVISNNSKIVMQRSGKCCEQNS